MSSKIRRIARIRHLAEGLAVAGAAWVLFSTTWGMVAASEVAGCKAAPIDATAWTNPRPDDDDFVLPLGPAILKTGADLAQVSMVMAFRKVPLSGSSFFGDERSVFEAGSRLPIVFETRQSLRAASPIFEAGKLPILLAGKYEVSLAQYAWAMGQGNILEGLSGVPKESRASWPAALKAYAGLTDPCHGVFTAEVGEALALPVTDMPISQFSAFVAAANSLCFANASCAQSLGNLSINERIPANLRLPASHEWEFIAKGGLEQSEEGPAGTVSVPLAEIANVKLPSGDGEPRLRSIGAGTPYLSFHDLYGNAAELMAGHFLAEAVIGGVGGAAVRGGSFATDARDLRPSAVAELPSYTINDTTGEIVEAQLENTGLRLFLGVPLVGATERIGSDELERIYSAAFSKIGTGKDRAGNNFVEARAMREIKATSEPFVDELDASDTADYLSFPLAFFADATLRVGGVGPLRVRLLDSSREEILSFRYSGRGPDAYAIHKITGLLPGKYFAIVESAGAFSEGQDVSYNISITGIPAADTGLSGDKITRDAFTAALTISTTPRIFEGYVGADDPFDTFPAALDGDQDGLSFSVSGNTAPVEIRVLDSRGQILYSRMLDGTREGAYPVPILPGAKVFIQVVSMDGEATRYKVSASLTAIFSKGLSASRTVAAAAADGEYSGYLHENIRSLYRRVTLTGRKKLRIELTGLDRDADLAVFDAQGNAIESGHRRAGAEPEVFAKDLPGGEYLVAINRKSGAGTLAPFDLVISEQAAAELSPSSIASAREKAKPLAFGASAVIDVQAGLSYFYFDPPSALSEVRLSLLYSDRLRLTLEDDKGSVLLTRGAFQPDTLNFYSGPLGGRKYIRLEGEGSSASPPQISVALGGEMPPEEFWFKGATRDGNWHFVNQQKQCSSYTYATDLRPTVGWIRQRPFLIIEVNEGQTGAFIGLASSAVLAGGKQVVAFVTNSKRKATKVQLTWDNGWLKPVVYDKRQKQFFLNDRVIRQIVGGSTLEISGLTPNGSTATLRFDLAGMREASNRIVKECRLKRNPFR